MKNSRFVVMGASFEGRKCTHDGDRRCRFLRWVDDHGRAVVVPVAVVSFCVWAGAGRAIVAGNAIVASSFICVSPHALEAMFRPPRPPLLSWRAFKSTSGEPMPRIQLYVVVAAMLALPAAA